MEKVGSLYSSSSGDLWLADTKRNIGSGDAGAATTRYYLSRDTEQDSSDIKVAESHATPSLSASDSDATLVQGAIPSGTGARTYYVIACADDTASSRRSRTPTTARPRHRR